MVKNQAMADALERFGAYRSFNHLELIWQVVKVKVVLWTCTGWFPGTCIRIKVAQTCLPLNKILFRERHQEQIRFNLI